jgi:hypothetical protein
VRKPPKPAPPREGHDRAGEGVAREGKEVYWWLRLMPPRGFQVLPRRWVEHLLLVEPEQEDEQELRASVRQRGSVRLCGDDPPDGERIGPAPEEFQTVSRRVILGSSIEAAVLLPWAQMLRWGARGGVWDLWRGQYLYPAGRTSSGGFQVLDAEQAALARRASAFRFRYRPRHLGKGVRREGPVFREDLRHRGHEREAGPPPRVRSSPILVEGAFPESRTQRPA